MPIAAFFDRDRVTGDDNVAAFQVQELDLAVAGERGLDLDADGVVDRIQEILDVVAAAIVKVAVVVPSLTVIVLPLVTPVAVVAVKPATVPTYLPAGRGALQGLLAESLGALHQLRQRGRGHCWRPAASGWRCRSSQGARPGRKRGC